MDKKNLLDKFKHVKVKQVNEAELKMEDKNQPGDEMEQDNEAKSGIDLDKILVEEIGQFGWFQLWTVTLAAIVAIFSGMANSEYVFTAARINTRCLIPECESPEPPEFSPSWILNAVPASGASFDSCQRFANISSTSLPDSCPASLFNMSNVINCEQYVYETRDSVVYDFELACQEWRRSFIGSAFTFGMLFSHGITGIVSDRWGRRTALVINGFFRAFFGLSRSWINSYVGFTVLEFLESFFGSGIFHSVYILVIELLGPRLRVAGGVSMQIFLSVGNVCTGLLAWAITDWRRLTQSIYGPMFIITFYHWIIPESIRWYISKGRYKEAEDGLKAAARVNKTRFSDKSLADLRKSAGEEKSKEVVEEIRKAKEPWLIVQVFRHKQVLIRCIVSPVWWVTNTFVYYGLSINSVNMSGNRYLNYMVVAAVEIPGYLISIFLMQVIGRKPVVICAFWLCAASQAAYIFMPNDYYGLSLTLYLIGKLAIAMSMGAVYTYTAELFPTKHRHSLVAFCSVVGRFGAILAPLTPAMGASTFDELPFVLFGSFALLSGCLVFVMPETLGAKFPDTMQEASDIGKKKDVL